MNVKVNGTAQELKEAVNVTELLSLNAVQNPEMVSVQLNGEFVDKANFASTQLKTGDEVDFLYFMGGGSR